MRHSLFQTFSLSQFVDLHGNAKTGEISPDKSKDENVFEIRQGVAVCRLIRKTNLQPKIMRGDVWGTRRAKYARLSQSSMEAVATEHVVPTAPTFAIEPSDDVLRSSFRANPSLGEIFPHYSTGIATARDGMAVRFEEVGANELRIDFSTLGVDQLREKYDLGEDTNDWKVSLAVADIKAQPPHRKIVTQYYYRPFDKRWTIYTGKPRGFLCNPRLPVMRNLSEGSIGLCTIKSIEGGGAYSHLIASNLITDHHAVSLKEVSYVLPLWLHPQGTEIRTFPNIAPAFAQRIATLTGLGWDDCVEGPRQGALGGILPIKPEQTALFAIRRERGEKGKSCGPRDLFDWIYAVLHSPAYRQRYADYLKSDFARVPLPASRELFEALLPLGTELVALHLLDSGTLPILVDPKSVRLAGHGEARVAHAPAFDTKLGRVTINASRWFETVPETAWSFHVGGYQPAEKWLKDRAAKGGRKANPGRVLTPDDILHYRRIIVALTRTAELMREVDRVIAAHGGWPKAFRGMTDEVAAAAAAE
jgi:predicted helicase